MYHVLQIFDSMGFFFLQAKSGINKIKYQEIKTMESVFSSAITEARLETKKNLFDFFLKQIQMEINKLWLFLTFLIEL